MKVLTTLLILVVLFNASGQTFTDSNIPIVVISTNGQQIVDDPRIVAHMGIIDNGPGVRNYLTDPFTNYDGRIEIEIRGSTSQQYPKKGYGFETQDALGNNLQVAVLGMSQENDWILNGPYPDKTLIRNALTFDLSRKMGHYAPDTRFCELVINGEYRGVYIMMERIKRDVNRVNIEDIHIPNSWDDTLTGGYIVKVDKLTGDVGYTWESNYSNEVLFQFHDPEFDELNSMQVSYMENYIGEFEDAIFGPNFEDPNLGYPAYINTKSFYDFFILQELGRTVDGYRSSSFMYKDRNTLTWNAKLQAGPMWDFNLSYGNADYCDAQTTTGWQYNFDEICNFTTQIPFWWERLLDSDSYRNGLRCRWEELRQGPLHTDSINNYIDAQAEYLEEARIRNFQKWPIIGVYVNWNGFVGQTYQEDLNFLKQYIEQRSIWIDNNLSGNCNLSVDEPKFEPAYHKAWPNPATNEVNIGFSLMKGANVTIELYDVTGRILKSIDKYNLTPGSHAYPLELSGINAGNYIYLIRSNEGVLYQGKISIQ